MDSNTYISIIFAIIITALLGNFINILIQQPSKDKKKYTKLLILLTTLLITAATIIYKYNLFILCVSEIFSYIIECIPFFYNSLMSVNINNYGLLLLIAWFTGVMIGFHSQYSAHISVLYAESPKIYFVIVEIIYVLVNMFLFILLYYIFKNTSFSFISIIIFILLSFFSAIDSTVWKLINIAEYLENLF